MTRCWSMEPTGERIVEDIIALPRVLDIIIANKGCVVKDEFLRTGRRHRRADDTGDLKRKPVMKQRISTLKSRPCHADCLQARSMLTGQPYVPAAAVAVVVAQPVPQPAHPVAAVAVGVAQPVPQPALPAAAVGLNMQRVQEALDDLDDEDKAQEVGGPRGTKKSKKFWPNKSWKLLQRKWTTLMIKYVKIENNGIFRY